MILLTGATGQTGKELVKLLKERDYPFRALVRDPRKAAWLKDFGGEVVQGDLDKPDSVEKALKDCTKLYLLTTPSPKQPEQELQAIKLCRKVGTIKHIIKFSALGSGTEKKSQLLKWHALGEIEMRKVGIPYTILKPHMFMQNFLMFAPTIKSQGTFYAPMRDGKIACVDVRDIAAVAAEVITGKGHSAKSYELTGPESLTFAEYAQKLTDALGKPVKFIDVPPSEARKAMAGQGMPDYLVTGMLDLYEEFASGKADKVSESVQKVTGQEPRTFEMFCASNLAAFR